MTTHNSYTPPPFTCPAVSVIIPMYNAEKYIAECLESILAQTFTNFEVIIVDDCSTDSSCAIVESYTPKFGGRLQFMCLESNSGTGGYTARNKGFIFARGEYVFFMDADDLLTKIALEELYTLAKNFDADVVHCEKYYSSDNDGKNCCLEQIKKGTLVSTATFQTENLSERVHEFCFEITWHSAWLRLVNRDFLLRNNITFPEVRTAGDIIWCFEITCVARRILRIPNLVYVYRKSLNSNLRKKKGLNETISFYMSPVIKGVKFLDNFLNRLDFFKQNSQYRYAVMDYLIQIQLNGIGQITSRTPANIVDEIIRQEFSEDMGEQGALISYCFSRMNVYRLQLIQAQQQIMQFKQFTVHAQEQVNKFNQFAAAANKRIAELEAELKRLKS